MRQSDVWQVFWGSPFSLSLSLSQFEKDSAPLPTSGPNCFLLLLALSPGQSRVGDMSLSVKSAHHPNLGVAYHASVSLDDDDNSRLLILCGTHSASFDSAFTNAVWEHNTVRGSWKLIPGTDQTPSPRALASVARCGSKVFLFGGYRIEKKDYKSFNDIYALDIGNKTASLYVCISSTENALLTHVTQTTKTAQVR